MRAPHSTWPRRSSVSITTQKTGHRTAGRQGRWTGQREIAPMTLHEAANAAIPDLKAVHTIIALLTWIFDAVEKLILLDCVGGRPARGQRFVRTTHHYDMLPRQPAHRKMTICLDAFGHPEVPHGVPVNRCCGFQGSKGARSSNQLPRAIPRAQMCFAWPRFALFKPAHPNLRMHPGALGRPPAHT